jgi:hypothetical protein
MKHVLIGMGIAVMVVSVVFAKAKDETAVPSASDTLADVRRAIDKGNAQWSEGWAKGDAAMVAALFADDGVQLTGSGRSSKVVSRSWSVKKQPCRASILVSK